MQTIYKYEVKSRFSLQLPKGAQILCVQMQAAGTDYNYKPQMWVMQNPDIDTEYRDFESVPTGAYMDHQSRTYIGTFQIDGLVFHVFELLK